MFDNVTCPHCGEVSHIGGLIGPHTNDCPKCGKVILKGINMKTYQIELKRTSYVTFEIEAHSEEDAQAFAWDRLNGYYNEDASWEIESTQEMESC